MMTDERAAYIAKRVDRLSDKIETLSKLPLTKETKKQLKSSCQAVARWLKIIEEECQPTGEHKRGIQ